LRDAGKLEVGQKVLIIGAAGGVGTFAVQIAKALGAEVTAVCGTKNLDLVRSLGADRVIDYTQQDFTQEAIQYDVIFEIVGSKSFSECKPVLKSNGIYVTTQPTPGNFFNSALTNFLPGQTAKVIVAKPSGDDLTYLKEQIETGKIRVILDRTYPLSETEAAHRYSEAGHATGKIVITVAH
jgi:NADPH:quinone reductase-like Zn-dependent oxidoreductase